MKMMKHVMLGWMGGCLVLFLCIYTYKLQGLLYRYDTLITYIYNVIGFDVLNETISLDYVIEIIESAW